MRMNRITTEEKIAYLFLYLGFLIIFLDNMYYCYDDNRPLGYFFGIFTTLVSYGVYFTINRLLIMKVIPLRIINLFEILLLISLVLTLYASANWYDRHSLVSIAEFFHAL